MRDGLVEDVDDRSCSCDCSVALARNINHSYAFLCSYGDIGLFHFLVSLSLRELDFFLVSALYYDAIVPPNH